MKESYVYVYIYISLYTYYHQKQICTSPKQSNYDVRKSRHFYSSSAFKLEKIFVLADKSEY